MTALFAIVLILCETLRDSYYNKNCTNSGQSFWLNVIDAESSAGCVFTADNLWLL